MGLILDTTLLIHAERRGVTVRELLTGVKESLTDRILGISAISVVELTHGIYRAKSPEDRVRRQAFADDIFGSLRVYPVTLEIGQLAGRIEGEQAAIGIGLPFPDLVIGATALHFRFSVLTHNTKHFQLIPGLTLVSL